ncbi:hypothetical protein S7711_02860 [Stachybotrys chartarum IBT 7711]|uniref:Clr5 domain-containing protein n=1 Tax=Stachybotrys chartarum (strain CBS 109288 / IBT 7711) TaxID=1280523 RepID=A0A084AH81_STACB|nr:hypothetical protein S7711_02860 [Stachybotrys chartarum IBT 7711]
MGSLPSNRPAVGDVLDNWLFNAIEEDGLWAMNTFLHAPGAPQDVFPLPENDIANVGFPLFPSPSFADTSIFDVGTENVGPALPENEQSQTEDPHLLGTVVEAQALPHESISAAPAPSSASRKKRPRGKLDWAAQKPKIRRLYLEEDNTLEETRRLMRSQHGFTASTQMYKERFQDWGFVKKISHKVAGKLSRIADERKPKDTEFRIGPRTWTASDIKKKHNRTKESDESALGITHSPVLPTGLVWRTPTPHMSPAYQATFVRPSPRMVTVSPGMPLHAEPNVPSGSRPSDMVPAHGFPGSPWQEAQIFPALAQSSPQLLSTHDRHRQFPLNSPGTLVPPLPPLSVHPWDHRPTNFPTSLPQHPIPLPRFFETTDKTISELQSMRLDASRSVSEGKIDEAVRSLRGVVNGFQALLAPTHDFTIQSGYQLVQLLGEHDGMSEAISILEWLGSSLVSKHGLHHDEVLKHYLKVIFLLRTWSREEDAKLLTYKLSELWFDDNPDLESGLKIPGTASGMAVPTDISSQMALFGEPQDADDVDAQLKLVRVLMSSRVNRCVDLEAILLGLICYSDRNELPVQSIGSRCCLAAHFQGQQMGLEAIGVLDAAQPMLERNLPGANTPAQPLLKASQDMAFLYADCGSLPKCEDILELTAESLEAHVGLDPCKSYRRTEAIEFPISVGVEWQNRQSWDNAAAWFERALANSMKILGRRHAKTQILEMTLEKGIFISGSADILTFGNVTLITEPMN